MNFHTLEHIYPHLPIGDVMRASAMCKAAHERLLGNPVVAERIFAVYLSPPNRAMMPGQLFALLDRANGDAEQQKNLLRHNVVDWPKGEGDQGRWFSVTAKLVVLDVVHFDNLNLVLLKEAREYWRSKHT